MNTVKKTFLIIIKILIFLNVLFWTAVATVGIYRKEYISFSGTATISILLLFAIAPLCLYWLANRLFRFDLKKKKTVSVSIRNIFAAMLSIPRKLRSVADKIVQFDISKIREGLKKRFTKKRSHQTQYPMKTMVRDHKTDESVNLRDCATNIENNLSKKGYTACLEERKTEKRKVENGWLEKIIKSEAFQIFFVRARKDEVTRKIYILFFFCFLMCYTFLILSFDCPLKLEEMKTKTGYFERYDRNPAGGTVYDKISIRYDNGDIEDFTIAYRPEILKSQGSLKGKAITIYYRNVIKPYLSKEKRISAIKQKKEFILEYDEEDYDIAVKLNRVVIIMAVIFSILSLWIIYSIFKKHRNK